MKEASTPKKHVQGAVRKCNLDQQQTVPPESVFEEQMRRPAPIANMIARPASPVNHEAGVSSLPNCLPRAPSAETFPLDPALFRDNANSISHKDQASVGINLPQSISPSAVSRQRYMKELSDKVADPWHTDPCPAPGIEIGTATLESGESFEPPASSLVSPLPRLTMIPASVQSAHMPDGSLRRSRRGIPPVNPSRCSDTPPNLDQCEEPAVVRVVKIYRSSVHHRKAPIYLQTLWTRSPK